MSSNRDMRRQVLQAIRWAGAWHPHPYITVTRLYRRNTGRCLVEPVYRDYRNRVHHDSAARMTGQFGLTA